MKPTEGKPKAENCTRKVGNAFLLKLTGIRKN